jgi:hypothetical protein
VEVGITDLVSAFSKVLSKAQAPIFEVASEPWTVEMKVKELRVLLAVNKKIRFFDLFSAQKTTISQSLCARKPQHDAESRSGFGNTGRRAGKADS